MKPVAQWSLSSIVARITAMAVISPGAPSFFSKMEVLEGIGFSGRLLTSEVIVWSACGLLRVFAASLSVHSAFSVCFARSSYTGSALLSLISCPVKHGGNLRFSSLPWSQVLDSLNLSSEVCTMSWVGSKSSLLVYSLVNMVRKWQGTRSDGGVIKGDFLVGKHQVMLMPQTLVQPPA